ncbi:MAG: acetyltransferase [Thiomicrospira sp.]|uniref:acetyltransferase n=1 Tax=Thiomicrospira sp. TaxID=935 RepID=UPI0019DC6736|nr:acetyltransferase [Thiomicrospira sp.]MBE0494055.1 acetyltransferase [Thiomicrospira sp.]
MVNTPILLIGGGGHGRALIDVIEQTANFTIAGIVEAQDVTGEVLSYPILGCDADLPGLVQTNSYCLISVGQVKQADLRIKLFNLAQQAGAKFPRVISPKAYVSAHAEIGEGTVVMHQALVNIGARVGQNCIINSQALIEHDAVIGDHCHISTGAKINGQVTIGNGCLVGSGTVIKQGVKIADNVIIGAGALILKDITRPGFYVGYGQLLNSARQAN